MKRIGPIGLISLIGLITVFAGAKTALGTDFSSTNFVVKDPVIEGLGGYSTSTSFQLWGTIPFIEPRTGTSSSFTILPGFLNFPSSTATSSTPTPSPTPAGGGGGGGIAVEPRPKKPKPPEELLRLMDCNSDQRINLVDLSCLLYYADKTGPIIEPHDFNRDGIIDLIDVSILLYYWYDP